jgi:hypothetical protein
MKFVPLDYQPIRSQDWINRKITLPEDVRSLLLFQQALRMVGHCLKVCVSYLNWGSSRHADYYSSVKQAEQTIIPSRIDNVAEKLTKFRQLLRLLLQLSCP